MRAKGNNRPAQSSEEKKNPVSAFIAWWNARGERKEAEFARMLTANRAKNEQQIRSTLAAIDFTSSKIPQEILDAKTNPDQPYGDLELTAKGLQAAIISTEFFDVDTKGIDTVLLELAKDFQDAVANGHVNAAFTAKAGLVSCIENIRNRIPHISDPDRMKNYLTNAVNHMRVWPAMVDQAMLVDEQQQTYNGFSADEKKLKAEIEEINNEFEQKLQSDIEYSEAYDFWQERTLASVKMEELTDVQRKVRTQMTELYFRVAELEYASNQTETAWDTLQGAQHRLNLLEIKAHEAVKSQDPAALDIFKDLMNDSIDYMNEMNVANAEFLGWLDEFNAAMKEMRNNPAAIKKNAIAQEMVTQEFERIRKKQQQSINSGQKSINELLRKNGILSEEELKREKEKNEAEQAEAMLEQMMLAQQEQSQIQQQIEALKQQKAQQDAQIQSQMQFNQQQENNEESEDNLNYN